MNNSPLFILYGGQLLNVRDIKRAFEEGNFLRVEFCSGGVAFLEGTGISLADFANTINKLNHNN